MLLLPRLASPIPTTAMTPNAAAPADRGAERGRDRQAERECERSADHCDREGAARVLGRHGAHGVARGHRPEEAGEHAAEHAGDEDHRVGVGDRRDAVDEREADHERDEQGLPRQAAGDGGERDRGDRGGDRVDRHELADLGFGRPEVGAHLRQEPGREDLGDDPGEDDGGEGEQPVEGQTRTRSARGGVRAAMERMSGR